MTVAETDRLVELYDAGLSQKEIGERLGRSPRLSQKEIAVRLGRSPSAVWHCLRRFGLVGRQ
jgi:DNA-binding CsgD family transcriptional regulator